MGTEKQLKSKTLRCYIAVAFVTVVAVWTLNWLLPFLIWPESSWSQRGTFGDMFGVANSLFSALAFVGLIIAILLQRQELQLQREELVLARAEMKGQREQLEGQKDQMQIQNFENRFFQTVGLWNELRTSLKGSRESATGQRFFHRVLMPELQDAIINEQSECAHPDDLRCIDVGVQGAFARSESEITNYMRLLYNIMKLIDRSEIDLENQKFYSNIVRAQLSQAELVVIFYDGLSELGRYKFKPLIEKYSLLQHLNREDLVAQPHPSLYDPKAYA